MKKLMGMIWMVAVAAMPALAADEKQGEKLAGAALGISLVLLVCVGIVAVLFLVAILQAPAVRRGSARVGSSAGRCFLIGLLGVAVLFAGATLLQALPASARGVPGLVLLLVLAWLVVSGLCLVAHHIGERVQTALMSRHLGSDAMAVLYGAILVLTVGLFPVVGQLVQLIALLIGMGAVIRSLFERMASQPAPPAPPVTPPVSNAPAH